MASNVLPDSVSVISRDAWVAKYKRSYQIRDPEADVGEDTQVHLDATALADQLVIISGEARQVGRSIALASKTTAELDQILAERGMPLRFPETGSQGAITISADALGTSLLSGDELVDDNGLRYQCIVTGTFANGATVAVAAIDTGPTTNLDPGTELTWVAPRPHCIPTAVVTEQTDGSGLSGGRLQESNEEVVQRISDSYANPASAGNDAYYQQLIENSHAHGVSAQKAFTWPSALGAGTTAFSFTMKPATPGSQRLPNTTQLTQVLDYVQAHVPADDQPFAVQLLAQPVNIVLDVNWAAGANNWVDPVPWPPRYATGAGAIVVSAASNAVSFTLRTDNNLYTGITPPVAGQTIGLFDQSSGLFREKRILTVTGTGPWVIDVDTAGGASDTTYTPVVGTRASPWSDSLQDLLAPVLSYFGTLGPGELFTSFFDPGLRQKRSPAPPKFWPNTISNRLAADILEIDPVNDSVVREGLGTTTSVGVPAITAYLLELGDVAAFAF